MSTMSTMRQCDCGAYRLAEKIDGQWRWQGGCRACDTIERLRILLDAGTRVTTRESPSRLRERLERAEREADRLHAKVDEMERAHPKEIRKAFEMCPMRGGKPPVGPRCESPSEGIPDVDDFAEDWARQLIIRLANVVREQGDADDIIDAVREAMEEAEEMLGTSEDWN